MIFGTVRLYDEGKAKSGIFMKNQVRATLLIEVSMAIIALLCIFAERVFGEHLIQAITVSGALAFCAVASVGCIVIRQLSYMQQGSETREHQVDLYIESATLVNNVDADSLCMYRECLTSRAYDRLVKLLVFNCLDAPVVDIKAILVRSRDKEYLIEDPGLIVSDQYGKTALFKNERFYLYCSLPSASNGLSSIELEFENTQGESFSKNVNLSVKPDGTLQILGQGRSHMIQE